MNFEDLVDIYESQLSYIERMKREDNLSFYDKSKDYWDGYKKSTFNWFQKMKIYCDDFPEIERERIETFEKDDNYKQCELCGVLKYRSEKIPIYFDDYGEQLFAVYKGKEISGGAFNSAPEFDISQEIDLIKDNNY